ncbi:LIM/homeobox protein Awh-like [Clytia hemisphaerica]|uniref:Uncharacterized protein n=1 Tax=Clytia hemisphaerica TaxID=252671 RepID=A0A7M6DRF5_9CNID
MHNTEESPTPSEPLDIKCCSCYRSIQSTDWIRQAKQNVYHLACFSCDVCKRQLSTGEEFALLDDKILCKLHYVEQLELPASLSENHVLHVPPTPRPEIMPTPDVDSWNKPRNKRMRTSFSEEQVQVLQANFEIDANPDSAELERIASDVCLPKRVTQVWFQNSRARQKKQQQQAKIHGMDN